MFLLTTLLLSRPLTVIILGVLQGEADGTVAWSHDSLTDNNSLLLLYR